MFIATYTLWDKYAVSTLHTPPLLQGYAAFPVMFGVFALQAHSAGDRTARVWRAYRPQILGAAVLAPLAYILVLIALSFTAVSRGRAGQGGQRPVRGAARPAAAGRGQPGRDASPPRPR